MNQALEARRTEPFWPNLLERIPVRQDNRHSIRPRMLDTWVGLVIFWITETRDGRFSPEWFKRYSRREQTLVLALVELVVQGVSTCKLTETLCGASFSTSTGSARSAGLDPCVQALNECHRAAADSFICVDPLIFPVREADLAVSKAALIASGIRIDGVREILGIRISDSEYFATAEFPGNLCHALCPERTQGGAVSRRASKTP